MTFIDIRYHFFVVFDLTWAHKKNDFGLVYHVASVAELLILLLLLLNTSFLDI